MEQLLKDRVKLIRAMINASSEGFTPQIKEAIDNKIINKVRKDDVNRFLSLSQDDLLKVSYSTAKEKLEDQAKQHKQRTKTSLGRYIRKQLEVDGVALSDSLLTQFCNKTFLHSLPIKEIDANIKFLSGPDISKFYHNQNNKIYSCMTGNPYLTELYSLNPDKVQLLIYKKELRALLWNCDDGSKVLDKIYPAGHGLMNHLVKWAIHYGYFHRMYSQMFANSTLIIKPNDSRYHKTVTMKYDHTFPYLDTFCYGKIIDKNTVQVSTYYNGSGYYNCCFTSTDGCFSCSRTDRYCRDCGIKFNANSSIEWVRYNDFNLDPLLNHYSYTVCYNCFENYKECPTCGTYVNKDKIYNRKCAICSSPDERQAWKDQNNNANQEPAAAAIITTTPTPVV